MTSGAPPISVRSFDDAMKQEYKVFTVGGSAPVEMMKNSKEGSGMHSVYYQTMNGNEAAFVKDIPEVCTYILRHRPERLEREHPSQIVERQQAVSHEEAEVAAEVGDQAGEAVDVVLSLLDVLVARIVELITILLDPLQCL